MRRVEAGKEIRLEQVRVPVTVYYEARRSSRVSIGRRGVHIRVPAWLSRAQREEQVRALRRWAEQRLQKNPRDFLQRPARSYREGERLDIGGRGYLLRVERGARKHGVARIEGDRIRVRLPAGLSSEEEQELLPGLIARAAAREYLPLLQDTLQRLNETHFRRRIGAVAFRNNQAIWGSCSPRGNISIATRLLLAPAEVLEYVCIHELAHLVERRHSPRFWSLVEGALPGWRRARRWLRDNQQSCRF